MRSRSAASALEQVDSGIGVRKGVGAGLRRRLGSELEVVKVPSTSVTVAVIAGEASPYSSKLVMASRRRVARRLANRKITLFTRRLSAASPDGITTQSVPVR